MNWCPASSGIHRHGRVSFLKRQQVQPRDRPNRHHSKYLFPLSTPAVLLSRRVPFRRSRNTVRCTHCKTELPSNFRDFVMAVRNLLIEYDLLIAFVQRLTQDVVATLYSLTCKEQKLELFADTTLTASDVRDLHAHEQAKASAMRKLKKPNRRRSRGKKTPSKPLP